MKNKLILKSGILFLVIALLIGGIVTVSLANNYGSKNKNYNTAQPNQSPMKGNNGTAQQKQLQQQECDGACTEDNNQHCNGECDGTCDANQIKVSGSELKAMSIADIADLWKIDATSLLDEIVSTFNLKNTYAVDNTIDDLRGEYRFSPFQIKDLADKLLAG